MQAPFSRAVAALLRSRTFFFPRQQQQQLLLGRFSKRSSSSSSSSSSKVGYYGGSFCCLLGSPLAFSDWQTQTPKGETFLFLSGNAIGGLTERVFENEAGQSLFMVVLFLAYLALLGFEGRLNGGMMRLKHAVATNWQLPVHRNYMHALPPNPLLQRQRAAAAEAAMHKKNTSSSSTSTSTS